MKTLKELSFSSEESLVVGDMPVDIEMGRSAGVCTCGVTYGNSSKEDLEKAGADYVVEDIIELMDIVSA
ncbi:MAG: HAD hydrolase-like protein [Lachnospiraceae bacterium]|nr:HAD hydrolase-like protein [Lachnospiraceae bacterium]